jgi:predicted nucleic acid-binding protein
MPPHGFRRTYGLEAFGAADFSRARELLGACPHLSGFGIADASNVVLAARYDTTDILTTDQRDFREAELPGGRYFRILTYDL